MNIYFNDLKRHSKNHERANEIFAEKVQSFLNQWKSDWHLVYLHMHLPLAPFVFAFLAKPSKEINKLNEYFNNWSMSPENYYYGDELEPLLDFRYPTEGFNESDLKKWAKHLNLHIELQTGSLTVLEYCLNAFTDKAVVAEIIKQLKNLHKIKSSITSHGGGTKLPKNAIISSSNTLIIEISKAMEKLKNILMQLNNLTAKTSQ